MDLLTVEEVAEILRMTPIVVRRWLQQGKLPGFKLGKEWRVDKNELENYVNSTRYSARKKDGDTR